MVKVIKCGTPTYLHTCEYCNSELEYTDYDTIEDYVWASPEDFKLIQIGCPICNNFTTIHKEIIL